MDSSTVCETCGFSYMIIFYEKFYVTLIECNGCKNFDSNSICFCVKKSYYLSKTECAFCMNCPICKNCNKIMCPYLSDREHCQSCKIILNL